MSDILVRDIRSTDVDELAEWLKDNVEDLGILARPSTRTLAAHTEDRVIMYAPAQTVVMVEALGTNPEATETEKAAALRALMQTILFLAQESKIDDVYFFTGSADEKLERIASRHGFEELPFKVWRRRAQSTKQRHSNSPASDRRADPGIEAVSEPSIRGSGLLQGHAQDATGTEG